MNMKLCDVVGAKCKYRFSPYAWRIRMALVLNAQA